MWTQIEENKWHSYRVQLLFTFSIKSIQQFVCMKRSIHSGASVMRPTNEVIRGLLFRFLLTLCVLLIDLLGRNNPARVFSYDSVASQLLFRYGRYGEKCETRRVSIDVHFREFIQSLFAVNNNIVIVQHARSAFVAAKLFLKKLLYFSQRQKEKKVLTRNCIHESFNENNNNRNCTLHND